MQNYVQAQNDASLLYWSCLCLTAVLYSPHFLLPSSTLSSVHCPELQLLLGLYIVVAIAGMAALRRRRRCFSFCCPNDLARSFLSSSYFYFVFAAVFVVVLAYLSTIAVCCFKWFLSVVFCAWAVLPFLMNQSTHTCSKLVLPECVCVWSAAACVRSLYGDLPQIGGHKHWKIISSLSPRLGQPGQTLVSFPRSFPTCRYKKIFCKMSFSLCSASSSLFSLYSSFFSSSSSAILFALKAKNPRSSWDWSEREQRIKVQRGVCQVLTAFSILKYLLCLFYDLN